MFRNYKIKECSECGQEKEIVYSSGCLCFICNNKRLMNRHAEKKKNVPLKKRAAIKPFSDKLLKRNKEYRELRDKYLADHIVCEVKDCSKPTTNLHHKKGRSGDNLTNIEFFMACCGSCHPTRIHETDVAWAKEMGYVITR